MSIPPFPAVASRYEANDEVSVVVSVLGALVGIALLCWPQLVAAAKWTWGHRRLHPHPALGH